MKAPTVSDNPYASPLAASAGPEAPRKYRSAEMLVRLLSVVLVLLALGEGLFVALLAVDVLGFDDFGLLADVTDVETVSAEKLWKFLLWPMLGGYLIRAALFYSWLYRANVNARALGAVGIRFKPIWCIAWFFIPIANLWKPLQVMCELYRASNPSASDPVWAVTPVPGTIGWWWATWLGSMLVTRIDIAETIIDNTLGEVTWGDHLDFVTMPLNIVNSLLCLAIVRSIHNRLEAKHALQGSPALP